MHLHTPHLKKSEKRKASITSTHSEEVPITKKRTKSKKTKTSKPPKQKKLESRARSKTPEDPHPQPPTPELPPSALPEPNMSSPLPSNTLHKSPTTQPNNQPDGEATGPRRSSRIRNSMSGIANTWHKARPYIERINGTIMPLEHQGVAAYYAKDGVKI